MNWDQSSMSIPITLHWGLTIHSTQQELGGKKGHIETALRT